MKNSEKSVLKGHCGVILLAILSSRATLEAILEDRHLDLVSRSSGYSKVNPTLSVT